MVVVRRKLLRRRLHGPCSLRRRSFSFLRTIFRWWSRISYVVAVCYVRSFRSFYTYEQVVLQCSDDVHRSARFVIHHRTVCFSLYTASPRSSLLRPQSFYVTFVLHPRYHPRVSPETFAKIFVYSQPPSSDNCVVTRLTVTRRHSRWRQIAA